MYLSIKQRVRRFCGLAVRADVIAEEKGAAYISAPDLCYMP